MKTLFFSAVLTMAAQAYATAHAEDHKIVSECENVVSLDKLELSKRVINRVIPYLRAEMIRTTYYTRFLPVEIKQNPALAQFPTFTYVDQELNFSARLNFKRANLIRQLVASASEGKWEFDLGNEVLAKSRGEKTAFEFYLAQALNRSNMAYYLFEDEIKLADYMLGLTKNYAGEDTPKELASRVEKIAKKFEQLWNFSFVPIYSQLQKQLLIAAILVEEGQIEMGKFDNIKVVLPAKPRR